MVVEIDKLIEKCANKAIQNGWAKDPAWSHRGCYLHLEASELIESLRGKGDSTPEKEAADVLFVLFSLIGTYNVSISDVMDILCDQVQGY